MKSRSNLEESLKKLTNADIKLRFGLMFYILNLVWVDKVMAPGEKQAIELAQKQLGISPKQVEAINTFVQKLGKIREQGLNDEVAMNALKEGLDNLKKVGVPAESFFPPDTGVDFNNLSMNYSDDVFIEKVGNLAAQAGKKVVENVLILFYAAKHPGVPAKAKMLIPGPLLYFMSPFDAVPDLLPGVGYSDDIGVLIAAVGTVVAIIASQNSEVKNSIMQSTKQIMKEWFGDNVELEEVLDTGLFSSRGLDGRP